MQNTSALFQKKDTTQSKIAENICKNDLEAIRVFLRTIWNADTIIIPKNHLQLVELAEKLWKLSAENFWTS